MSNPSRRWTSRAAALMLAAAALTAAPGTTVAAQAAAFPYQDPALPVATRVSDLLSRMSLDEKLGQMTQAERGSVSESDVTTYRLGSVLSGGGSAPSQNTATGWADMYDRYQNAALATPLGIPVIYGVDAVHGHNNVYGATIFPHNIGLGATRDPALAQRIGRAVAEEVSGTGIDWNFAPCLCVARNDRWGRTYESFGETPDLPSSMASIITGMQGSALNGPASVLATAKHYVGDGGTTGGTDQGNTELSEAELRAIHLPPFKEAVERGVGSVMISFSSWNGAKLHGHQYLISTVLKGELGFDGFVVSDWNGIDQIDGSPGTSAQDVRTAVNAGIDMVMVPVEWRRFIDLLRTEVQAGRVTTARVDDAVRRVLTKKFELGLFEKPRTDRSYTSTVGSAAHRALAREAVAKSQVVLKNAGNLLPLAKSGGKLFVAGKSADDIGNQSGGWTISWQGSSGAITTGTTILQGIRNTVGSGTTVTYSRDGSGIDGSYRAAIAVVGETPYAETQGDRPGGLGLDSTDLNTINTLRASGVPVVVVLVSGRPLDIAAQLPGWNALVAAWLPGTEGQGVADVLFGAAQPTGKLPMTWMSSASQQPINAGDGKTPLFPQGFGLTYEPAGGDDTSPPSTPGTPVASAVTSSSVTLTWAASTDDVGVTGYDVVRLQGSAETTAATSATASAALTGLTANTSYTFAVYARDAAGNRSARSGTVTLTTTGGGTGSGCTATPSTQSQWGNGYVIQVTVTNTGTAARTGWTVTFTLPPGHALSGGWNGTFSTFGQTVTVRNAAHNGALGAGASTSFGFQGTRPNGDTSLPSGYTCA
ncbi:Beta-glucosidase [[Actinomadura] parvosata subsp. kistnae]|uniref:beta-glucosidase n=1 Tax=[Actinomadura] parvosata subsp. kistnae TaxID=1909395 RepID=A0A1V0A533_9ACTN|nr:glycoside hydrolase family 3 N-terminal domain-containing protein [Nonomuraea sp. ATCC 55076]AQZ65314.1 beta-glucosidase [Nonomuraea sp. ATCC 55076]SPL96633.1 Beta-glucosidase [Actinomadura parvosata subsp. kistnae]